MEAGGDFCTPANDTAREIVASAAAQLGVAAKAVVRMPGGPARKLKPVRIGLYDQYGGLTSSGWTRWLLEQFEFPFEVVYPQALDRGELRQKFDVLLFPDEAYQERTNARALRPETVPAEYRDKLGRITQERTAPALKAFVEAGGAVLTIGSSTGLAPLLGVNLTDHMVAQRADGTEQPLRRDEFYIPGSLLKINVDSPP